MAATGPAAAGLRAQALTRETLAALQETAPQDFLLVPESEASSVSAARSLEERLPQVWQDLFAAARAAQSTEYLDGLACQPPSQHPCARGSPGGARARGGSTQQDDPALGITRGTVFEQYLSPEALVQHHRLGKPELRRLYQALQVYCLGFHQAMLELTAHATDRGLLQLALWRGFAMLWDSALQVVFPAETVQACRERQAALLMGEQLLARLSAEEERAEALEQDNEALRQQMEGMGVQVVEAQADASVAQQRAAGLEKQLGAARRDAAEAKEQVHARRLEAAQLQERLAALGGPQEELLRRAEQLEGLLREKQGQLSAAAKQAAAALAAAEQAKQAGRAELLAREAAERRAEELQAELEGAKKQLQTAQAALAASEQQAAAEAAARKRQAEEDAAARDDDTARLATERMGFQRAAAAAEADTAGLRGQLAAAQAALAEEKARSEQLAASMWPLAAKIKALEAAAAAAVTQ